MAHRHKMHKKAKGGHIPPMDEEYTEVTSKSSHDRKGGKVHKKKFGGMARGGKSHPRMDKRARGGSIKLKHGGSPALSEHSSKHPLSEASKVTSASK